GAADPAEPVVAVADVTLAPETAARVVLEPGDVEVPSDGERALVLVVELSGAVPHGAVFEATFLAAETRSEAAGPARQGERRGTGAGGLVLGAERGAAGPPGGVSEARSLAGGRRAGAHGPAGRASWRSRRSLPPGPHAPRCWPPTRCSR